VHIELHRILASVFASLLALVALAPALHAQQPDEQKQPRSIPELLAEIRAARDKVSYDTLLELASHANAEALEAFQKVVGWLEEPRALRRAYWSSSAFRQVDELKGPAVDFLRTEALKQSKLEVRCAAARTLWSFGQTGAAALEVLLRKSRDPEVRGLAAEGVISRLARSPDLDLLERVLDNILPTSASKLRAAARIELYGTPEAREVFISRLKRSRYPEALRIVLLDGLVSDRSDQVTKAILGALRQGPPGLQLHALEALHVRGEEQRATKAIEGLLRSKEADLRLAAIAALGRLGLDDRALARRVFKLSRSQDALNRLGATDALLELRTFEAIEALYGLITDPDWRVRSASVRGAVALRRLDALPHLIPRLDDESGRLHAEVRKGLQILTGLDLGRRSVTWQEWWDAEGAAFELPPLEEVEALNAKRAARKSEGLRSATFYGLPVLSDRVCFVVDKSGSMDQPAHMSGRTVSDKSGPTRILVALDQLRGLLKRIPDGHRCNVIFFDSRIRKWKKGVVPLDQEVRAEAMEFVTRQRAVGGTNLFDGLALAFRDPLVDTIYVLSDGQPSAGSITDPEEIRMEVRHRNRQRRIQIFSVSVGRKSALLKQLAEDGGGEYVEVGIPPKRDRTDMRSE